MSARTIREAGNITEVHTAYCPHCRAVINLSAVVVPCLAADLDGKEEIVISRTYHCEACGLFVKSEEDVPFLKADFEEFTEPTAEG